MIHDIEIMLAKRDRAHVIAIITFKHGAESTNATAVTEALVCIKRHNHNFLSHKLPEQMDHGDDVNQKNKSKFNEGYPIQEVDIKVGHNKRCYQHLNTTLINRVLQ